MKLFDDFEAVKFSQENMIFITKNSFLYYIYNCKSKLWHIYENAGNDKITVDNYEDITENELKNAMQGIFPEKETDFIRLCDLSRLSDMLDLLEEDYPKYMSDYSVSDAVYKFLSQADIKYKAFLSVKKIFDDELTINQDIEHILIKIKDLSLKTLGRDIFKKEISIIDGNDDSSYFGIMPIKIIDYSDTNCPNNIAEMKNMKISVEDDDVDKYLSPFLYKYYDDNLEANKKRTDGGTDSISGFEWYLTYNFFTFDSIINILNDIRDTADALSEKRENEFTSKIADEDDTDLVIDFYNRFIYRMEYMLKIGREKGYDLISFIGP